MTLNAAGYHLAVPIWVLERGLDATMVTFVGCVIVGFHTMGTLAATWSAVRDTTERTAGRDETGGRTGR